MMRPVQTALPEGPWPLHPQPREWEALESWVHRLAIAYGSSYDAFIKHALGRKGQDARDLDGISDAQIRRLSAGTRVRPYAGSGP